jgi:Fur family transcriptional regulator, ferric uptake regulator
VASQQVREPVSDAHDEVTVRLTSVGQRLTGNRAAIIEVLRAADRPLTLPEILSSRGDLAQSSAYRNLVVLEQAGIVHRIVTNAEHARFELAEDLTGDHHHHLVCSVCGAVEDVPASAHLEASLADAVEEIDRATGFTTDHHRIDLVGRCRACTHAPLSDGDATHSNSD